MEPAGAGRREPPDRRSREPGPSRGLRRRRECREGAGAHGVWSSFSRSSIPRASSSAGRRGTPSGPPAGVGARPSRPPPGRTRRHAGALPGASLRPVTRLRRHRTQEGVLLLLPDGFLPLLPLRILPRPECRLFPSIGAGEVGGGGSGRPPWLPVRASVAAGDLASGGVREDRLDEGLADPPLGEPRARRGAEVVEAALGLTDPLEDPHPGAAGEMVKTTNDLRRAVTLEVVSGRGHNVSPFVSRVSPRPDSRVRGRRVAGALS